MGINGYSIELACKNGKVIGFIAWSKSELLVLDTPRLNIESLVVDEKYRGQNISFI